MSTFQKAKQLEERAEEIRSDEPVENNFLNLYKQYVLGNTEAPILFHIWSAISGVATTLGKSFYFTRGHFRVYPNLYVMLIGSPGTGKGTCINILQKLLIESGYRTFAADKSSKEKFLADFAEGFSFTSNASLIEEQELGVTNALDFLSQEDVSINQSTNIPKEVFILAEEFNDFIGSNNTEFISLLTKLWSYEGTYKHRLKNSRSVSLYGPCINILGGTTSSSFAMAFPPEIIGQGFLARVLPIYGEPTGRKITFPILPSSSIREELCERLRNIRSVCTGEASIGQEARDLLDRINHEWVPLSDQRFSSYASRRFNQLIKLCLVQAAFRESTEITCEDVRAANTILAHTEDLMPKAIGEFGKAKNSDVTSKIMEMLYTTSKPLTTQEIWKSVQTDLSSITELANILVGLQHAEKIRSISLKGEEKKGLGSMGWLARYDVKEHEKDFINQQTKKDLQ